MRRTRCPTAPRPSCAATEGDGTCFAGDVAATLDFGFTALKIDSCGIERNMSHYARLFNLSGTAVVREPIGHSGRINPERGVPFFVPLACPRA